MNLDVKSFVALSCALSAASVLAGPPIAKLPLSRLQPPPASVAPVSPGSLQQLNPQPLPPKVWGIAPAPSQAGVISSLNPQPLPPKVISGNTPVW